MSHKGANHTPRNLSAALAGYYYFLMQLSTCPRLSLQQAEPPPGQQCAPGQSARRLGKVTKRMPIASYPDQLEPSDQDFAIRQLHNPAWQHKNPCSLPLHDPWCERGFYQNRGHRLIYWLLSFGRSPFSGTAGFAPFVVSVGSSGIAIPGLMSIGGRAGPRTSITITFTPNCAASFGSRGA